MTITKEHVFKLKEDFDKTCDTAEQYMFPALLQMNVMFDNTLKVLDKVTQSELQSMSRVIVGAITKPWVNMMPQPATDKEVEKYLCLV